jgi:hypothetical protein
MTAAHWRASTNWPLVLLALAVHILTVLAVLLALAVHILTVLAVLLALAVLLPQSHPQEQQRQYMTARTLLAISSISLDWCLQRCLHLLPLLLLLLLLLPVHLKCPGHLGSGSSSNSSSSSRFNQ